MDLKSLKRKELQALCKKHGLPANSTSSQMIESLSSILENHDKVKPKGCLKGSGGSSAEDLGIVGGDLKKKVTFAVEDEGEEEFEEITRSPVGDSKSKVVGNERRSTRSRGLAEAVLWSPVIEKAKKKKKSLRVGMQGVRRNDKLISGEVSTTRSLRNRVVVVGGDEELVTDENSRRIQKRKNIDEKKVAVVTEAEDDEGEEVEEITINPGGNSKSKSVVSNAVEIKGRSTRSRGLAEAVVWSPDIEKKKKKSLSVGTEGVRQNDKPISNEVSTTRSLRNRVVVVGGDEELATDQNSRRTQKRKISDKKEENEIGASELEEDEFVGRKNLRKRSRGGDFVGDEAPNRRSSRNHTNLEENVAVEEVDVGRSNKRRKKNTDGLIMEKGVDEDIERANRTKGMDANSDAMESRDVNNAAGQKKAQSQGKTRASKRGDPTTSTLDSEVVILSARRSTRSSSLIGTSDEEVRAVKKGKLQKHVKDGEGSEFVSEPVRRSTRSSSTLREDGTSIPVAGWPVEGAEEVSTGKSLKQAKHHGSEGGEVIAKPIRRSTRSSSVVGKSDEEEQAIKKGRSPKGGLPDSEVVAKPVRRATRTSSTLQEDEASLLVGKSVSVGEAVKKSKSQRQAKSHGSKGGSSTTSLLDGETMVEPVRRSTHSSSSLLENRTSLPAVEVVKEVKSHKQGEGRLLKGQAGPLSDNEATPMRRSTRSSSKSLEDEAHLSVVGKLSGDEEAIKNKKPGKEHGVRASKLGDSTAFLPENEAVTEPVIRSTRDSAKLLDGETFLPIVQGSTGKDTGEHSSKKEDHAIALSTRRPTRSSSMFLEDGSLPNIETFGSGNEVKTNKSGKKLKNFDLTASVPDNEPVTTLAPSKVSKELSTTFDTEISTMALPKEPEPDSIVEAGIEREDIITGYEAVHVSSSQFPESSEELSLRTDSHASFGIDLEEPRLKAEIRGASEDGLEYDGETDIVVPTLVCKNSEELTLTAVTEVDPEIDLKESDSKVEDDYPREDVVPDNEAINIFDPMTSDAEVCSDSRTSRGADLEEPRLKVEICGANEDGFDGNEETDIVVRASVCESSEELTLTSVTVANPEIDLKEPDSKVEVDHPSEDIVRDNEAKKIFDPMISDTEICSDSCTSRGTDLEEPRLKAEICGANEDGLDENEETDIVVQTSVCESSEELTLTSVTVANPEIDLKEPDSKVEDDCPREDVVPDNEAIHIFDPMTSDAGVCSDSCPSHGTDLEEPRLKVEICGANEDGLDENEETDIVVQTSVCESSEELTMTSATVANPEIDLKEPDSKVEDDRPREDVVPDNEAIHIFDPMTSDAVVCSDSCPSHGTDLEEPRLKAEICGANEDGLDGNEDTDIVVQTSVCESSEVLTVTSVTVANPEIDLKEPDSKVEVDRPCEDIVGDKEAKTFFDPMISDTEICSDSRTSCGTELEEPRLKAEICGVSEDGLDDNEETNIVVQTSVCESSELTLTSVTVANPEIDLKEPDSKVEVDLPSEDIVGDDEAKKIFDPMTSDTEVCSDSRTSRGTDLEEPRLKVEICGANEDGLDDNEEADIVVQTWVCESSELTLTSVTVANPEIDLKEPDSKVEVDCPSEDIVGDEEAKKIFDPMTSDTEACSDSRTSCGTDLEEPRLKVEICGANEDGLQDDEEAAIVVQTSICKSSEELTLTSVTVANPEGDLKEPDSKVEVDRPSEDIVGDDAKKIFDPMTSDTGVCSASRTSFGTNLEEPQLKVEICGANEDSLQDDEETEIVVQTSVCRGSEELTLTSVTVANPEIGLKEPDSKVEVDRPSEDIVGDDEAKKVSDPMTSDTEVCAEPVCDINVEGSDSKVEVHDASKGEMEQNEATTIVSSVMSCKSTGILSPTSLNEAAYHSDPGQVDTPAMNKEGFLIEASSIHCKTLEASMTVDRNPGDTSSTQRIFYNEMENCTANPDMILTSHPEHGECDTVKKIEAVACDEDPQLYKEDLEVIKETWVTSMVSVTVNDGIEIEDDSKDVEKNEHELRSSSPRESQPVQGTQSSPEELADAEQSDFTQSLYDKEPADAEKKLSVSFDDRFSAENSDSLMSPVAFMKSEGTSYAAPLEHKDEPFAFEIDEVSTDITEGEYSVGHRSSTQLLDASSKSEKQMEDNKLCDADVGSNGCSASSNENISLTDAVLVGDAKKVVERGVLPTLPVTYTCGEEILSISSAEAPTLLGNEGSTMQVDVQDFAYTCDNDDGRNLSDRQEVTVNVTGNLGVDFMDKSSKSAAKEHVDVEQLNANSDALPETSIIKNKLTDVEFERTIVFGAVGSEEMDNIGSWESEANAEGCDGAKADSIESDKVDHLDDVDQKRDEAFLLHEIKCFSGELHTDENASHTSVNNSASGSTEERVLLPEKVSPSTCMGNAPSLSEMDMVLPREEQFDKDYSEKASAEDDDTPDSEEFLSAINFIPLSNQQECQDTNMEEHAVDNNISMSVSGMDQYFGVEDEQSNKFQGAFGSFFSGAFGSFEQASNADEACISHCEAFTEKLFHVNDEAAASMNDNAEGGECEYHEENLGHGRCEEFSEIDSMKTLAIGDDEMKGVVSGSSVAVIEEACRYECETSSKDENLSGASAKTFVGSDSQATYSSQQSEDLGDGRTLFQQTPGDPIFLEDGKFSVLEESKLDKAFAPKRVVDCSSSEIDVNKEQNKQNTLDQIEDSNGRAQNTSYYQKL